MKKVRIYSDGGARGNPGPAAVGVVICDDNHQVLYEFSDTIGETTNNVAEYCALIAGLELAKRFHVQEVECCMDSELLMNQVSGHYRVKAEHLRALHAEVKTAESFFGKVTYHHKPREFPLLRHADRLVNEALDRKR